MFSFFLPSLLVGGFGCDELVLHDIRVLAEQPLDNWVLNILEDLITAVLDEDCTVEPRINIGMVWRSDKILSHAVLGLLILIIN